MRSLFLGIVVAATILAFPAVGQDENAYVPASGLVPDEATALRIAEAVLISIYGEDRFAKQQPLTASLVQDVWQVDGKSVPKGSFGRRVRIEISKRDGRMVFLPFGKPNASSM